MTRKSGTFFTLTLAAFIFLAGFVGTTERVSAADSASKAQMEDDVEYLKSYMERKKRAEKIKKEMQRKRALRQRLDQKMAARTPSHVSPKKNIAPAKSSAAARAKAGASFMPQPITKTTSTSHKKTEETEKTARGSAVAPINLYYPSRSANASRADKTGGAQPIWLLSGGIQDEIPDEEEDSE